MKLLDKTKPKELDFNDKLYDIWFESLCNGNYQMFQKKVKELLTQQRTELLEEILEHNKDEMTGLYDYDGIALEVISLVKK
jgi:hypothetical protein